MTEVNCMVRIYDKNGKIIIEKLEPFILSQKPDGLHLAINVQYKTTTRVFISGVEIDVGNNTWIEPSEYALYPGDTFKLLFDMHLDNT